jgi:hypothetical protein
MKIVNCNFIEIHAGNEILNFRVKDVFLAAKRYMDVSERENIKAAFLQHRTRKNRKVYRLGISRAESFYLVYLHRKEVRKILRK